MTKFRIFNVTIEIDVRTFIKKMSFPTYASFVLVTTTLFFKNRYALKTNQFTAPSTQVSFVQTSPPFAMMSMNFTSRSVQPVVERFEGNASIAETGGEVLVKHSNDIVHYVPANTHIKNVNKRYNALPISQKDRVVQVAKKDDTHFELYANNDIQSFENQKWRGFTFDYTYDFQCNQKDQPVKASDTQSYAFTSRYKIQRGDGTVNPFVPTKQLGRNTTLDLQAEQIEHVISNLTSNVSSEKNLTVLQGAQSGLQGGTSSESDGSGLSEAVTGSEGVHSSGPSEEGLHSTGPSSPSSEGSLVYFVQTGSEIELEPQEEAALEKKIVCGLGDMIVNAHNTSLLQKLQKSPKFETAAKLVHQDIGEELNQRLNAAPFTTENAERVFQKFPGLFQDPGNNQVSVYLEEPSVLTQLSRYVTLLEIGEKISVPEYRVNFTGDKKDSNAAEFSTFGSTVVYNQKAGFREEIKKNVKSLSNQTVSFSNAITLEGILTKVPEENRLAIFTRVVTNIVNEPQFKEEFLRVFVGNQEKSIPCITYDDKHEADHFLRKYLRTALGQRLLNTGSKNDKSLSVELPSGLHVLKEQFTNFREPAGFSYSNGLTEFLNEILKSVHDGLANTTPAQRRYVSVKQYQGAYTECYNAKVLEMRDKFPNFTEREKLMIYHAQVARIADQQDLEKFLEYDLSTFNLKKSVIGPDVERNINLFADLLRRNAGQRGGFIKTLAEFCSPECAEVINSIQEQHQYSVRSNFVQIEAMTHPLSEKEKNDLSNPTSLTKLLFPNFYNAESGKVESLSPEEIDQVLYAESLNMNLTNIGTGLPFPVPVFNYQAQETHVNNGNVTKAEKNLKENTNLLTQLLENTALIGDSRKPEFEFASKNAQELHVFLVEQGIPKALADKVVIEGKLENIEALQAALNDGSIQNIAGLGGGKAAKLKAVVYMNPQGDVSSTSDINSDPSNNVASQSASKPSVRRVKASKSTSDLVSQQKTKTTLSRISSMP